MNRTTRILAIALTTILVGVGIYAAYDTGFDNGARAVVSAGDNSGDATVVVPVDNWGRGYGWHGGFGFFPILPLLFLFLIFGIFRPRGFGGPGRGWNSGGWGPPHQMMDERMREWHEQAHNEGNADRPGS